MKKTLNFIQAYLPEAAHSSVESHRLHKFFVTSCFLTAIFALSYCLMSMYISGLYFAAAMVVSVLLFLLLPLLLRRGVPLAVLTHTFIAVIAIVLVLLIYWEGGIRTANTAPWALLLPAFAMLMQGPRAALVWLAVALSIVAGFSYFTFMGIRFPVRFDIAHDPLFNFLSMSGLLCLTCLIFYISESEKRRALLTLEEQKIVLERQQADLRSVSKEKDQYLRTVTHDLRNPLLIIQELCRYLADPELDEESKEECLRHIVSSADRMSELVRNLLDLQVIESGHMVLYRRPMQLQAMLDAYVSRTQRLADVRQIHLSYEHTGQDITIVTDKARLEQILDNYLSNAMKYCPKGTHVYIDVAMSGAQVQIAVRDEGPGISAAEQSKLFRQFSVASSVAREGEHSTGLGLAIVRKLATALGGEAGCISELGAGSTFYVRLPVK